MIVPYAAGGPLDEVARLLGPRLAELSGNALVVENRVGAGSSIGTEIAARAAPDGYTLLLGNSGPLAVNPNLQKVAYDPLKDLVPVTMVLAGQMALSVHPSLPARSLRDLVALARTNPGRINAGFIGVGNLMEKSSRVPESGLNEPRTPRTVCRGAWHVLLNGRRT